MGFEYPFITILFDVYIKQPPNIPEIIFPSITGFAHKHLGPLTTKTQFLFLCFSQSEREFKQ